MSKNAQRYRNEVSAQRTNRKSRREKLNDAENILIKEKFQEEREEQIRLKPVLPMTPKQEQYFKLLRDPNIRIVIATGLAGTGKTFAPAALAADLLRLHHIDKIIVARPYVQTGKTSGFKPGSSLEKLYPYVRTMLDTMKKRLGYKNFENLLKDGLQGSIEVQELESIRGRSFDERSWLIVDESQQSSPEEMLSIVTRISDDCKLVLCGDLRQRDILGTSGLKWLMDFVKRHKIDGIGIVDFSDAEDVVRGGIVKNIIVGLMADEEDGTWTPQAK